MPRKLSNALSALSVKNAKPGRHSDGAGLQLLVKVSGARSWVFRYNLNGNSHDVGLGPASGTGAITLADARDQASELRLKIKRGIDPIVEKQDALLKARAAAQARRIAQVTFRHAAKAYLDANEVSWRNAKHRQQWKNSLETYVYPIVGDMPVAQVETSQILEILEPIWLNKPETASRVRGRIETVLDSAKARGYREGENPARWRGHLAQILPARKKLSRGHHKALPFSEIPSFLEQLRSRQAVGALALEFTILTAARTSEVLYATWSEIDIENAVWTIPAERMKAGNEHRVPLSARALEILEQVQLLGGTSVFPGGDRRFLSGMAMAMLLRRMGTDVTVHGFRSTFRDWAAECTVYHYDVAEMALAHSIGNKVERAYRRSDLFEKRRCLMNDWADYCVSAAPQRNKVANISSARQLKQTA